MTKKNSWPSIRTRKTHATTKPDGKDLGLHEVIKSALVHATPNIVAFLHIEIAHQTKFP